MLADTRWHRYNSETERELMEYEEKYVELRDSEKKLKDTIEQVKKSIEEADYIRFCLNELDNADLKEGEEESLREEIQILKRYTNYITKIESEEI